MEKLSVMELDFLIRAVKESSIPGQEWQAKELLMKFEGRLQELNSTFPERLAASLEEARATDEYYLLQDLWYEEDLLKVPAEQRWVEKDIDSEGYEKFFLKPQYSQCSRRDIEGQTEILKEQFQNSLEQSFYSEKDINHNIFKDPHTVQEYFEYAAQFPNLSANECYSMFLSMPEASYFATKAEHEQNGLHITCPMTEGFIFADGDLYFDISQTDCPQEEYTLFQMQPSIGLTDLAEKSGILVLNGSSLTTSYNAENNIIYTNATAPMAKQAEQLCRAYAEALVANTSTELLEVQALETEAVYLATCKHFAIIPSPNEERNAVLTSFSKFETIPLLEKIQNMNRFIANSLSGAQPTQQQGLAPEKAVQQQAPVQIGDNKENFLRDL